MKIFQIFKDIDNINYILKLLIITIFTFYTAIKINEDKNNDGNKIVTIILLIAIPICCGIIKEKFNSVICLVSLLILTYWIYTKNRIGYSILLVTISTAINYIMFFVATMLSYIPCKILNVNNNFINLIAISIFYIIMINIFLKIKKFKYGIASLKSKMNDEHIEVILLSVSVTIIFTIIIFTGSNLKLANNLFFSFILFAIIMFITIQKSLQLYYKQKLLVQELNETKEELENAKKELKQVEEENLNFSKKSHTLAHRQKSLEHKIQELEAKAEITVEEAGEVKDKLKEIEKDLYEEPATVELRKTEISQIDDMLKYMQSECIKNKINFELQLSGNIHYMFNNLISKDDLEILLADHIKDAIIAINHTDNINRSILVKLGEIEGIYSLYIYDSGIEFETETLENLGKKPSTTHADEGGTGMGFMNTFDTLRKYEATLIINELSKPNKDNYTKVLIFKFDKKNEFKIVSYRQSQPR